MALKNLFGWGSKAEAKASSACGTACGAGDKPEEKPAAPMGDPSMGGMGGMM